MTALGSPRVFHWIFCGGNRIHTPGMPGMTANHAPQCQPAASEKAMGLQGLGSIGRTAGIKTAGVRQQRRKEAPVAQDQQIWQTPHTIPAGAPPWKHDSGWALSTGNEARARVAGTSKNPLVVSLVSDQAGGPVLPGHHRRWPPEYSGGQPGRPTVPLPRRDLRFHFRNPAAAS